MTKENWIVDLTESFPIPPFYVQLGSTKRSSFNFMGLEHFLLFSRSFSACFSPMNSNNSDSWIYCKYLGHCFSLFLVASWLSQTLPGDASSQGMLSHSSCYYLFCSVHTAASCSSPNNIVPTQANIMPVPFSRKDRK